MRKVKSIVALKEAAELKKSIEQVVLEHVTRDKPITGLELREKVGQIFQIAINPIEMRNIIRKLRKEGHIIIGNSAGYMVAKSQYQVNRYVESRIKELEGEYAILDLMKNSKAYKRLAVAR